MQMPVWFRDMTSHPWKDQLILVSGVIQDAKFKRRDALADLAKTVAKK
jgi:hypothetical protein